MRRRPPLAGAAVLLLVLLVGALGLGGLACSRDETILSVNDWKLSRNDFVGTLDQIAHNQGYLDARSRNGTPFQVWKEGSTTEFDPGFVAELLNERVTFQLAQAELVARHLTVTDEDRQRAIAVIADGLASGTAGDTATAGTTTGTAPSGSVPGTTPGTVPGGSPSGRAVLDAFGSYRQVLIEGVASLQVLQRALTADVSTDDGLRQLYEQLEDDVATESCARHLLIRAGGDRPVAADGAVTPPTDEEYAAALATADQLRAQLDAGGDFATLAREHSQDTATAPNGGDLGCAPRGQYDPSFDDALWTQAVGQVGVPVKTVFGYHLVLVTERRVRTFDEVKGRLQEAVAAQGEQALQAWLANATKAARVTVDPVAGTWNAGTGLIDPPAGSTKVSLVPDDGTGTSLPPTGDGRDPGGTGSDGTVPAVPRPGESTGGVDVHGAVVTTTAPPGGAG